MTAKTEKDLMRVAKRLLQKVTEWLNSPITDKIKEKILKQLLDTKQIRILLQSIITYAEDINKAVQEPAKTTAAHQH